MGRFNYKGGYNHYCKRHDSFGTWYEIGWWYDKYYPNNRLRYPTCIARQTDEEGARRFCKKWDIEFPQKKVSNVDPR